MPFVDVEGRYAQPPRLKAISPPEIDRADIGVDDGYLDLRDAAVGPTDLPDGIDELDLSGCRLDGVELPAGLVLEARACELSNCDLSQVRIRRLENVVLSGCKLVGTDVSDTRIDDVAFEGCLLRYANLRMARLERVEFTSCTLHDVDLYEASLAEVTVVGSSFEEVQCGGVRWRNVDLRGARALGLVHLMSLQGALISDAQVIELAHLLALHAGADIESVDDR